MVAKVIELVGSSSHNWEEAVSNAGIEVSNFTAKINNGSITEYKANVHIAFSVHQ
ncbi:flavin-binding protein dodecin [Sporomusaceae bacterium BoRhaA]|uniref:dodecin family protein n=1 Tax=Pelorhabdus rhamnosifermentans TaxID=2772457 RepID=UPI001C063EFC|nr:dodecin family protein [Pelorhabdus rhamnosifermentans]MBU2702890.1 flavin-binding protein dodecin [Pelorhabdus rhamnosifermentans]